MKWQLVLKICFWFIELFKFITSSTIDRNEWLKCHIIILHRIHVGVLGDATASALQFWGRTSWYSYTGVTVDALIYTIYVHCRKMYNLFVWALETGRKARLAELFSCFAASSNKFIFSNNVHILFYPEIYSRHLKL